MRRVLPLLLLAAVACGSNDPAEVGRDPEQPLGGTIRVQAAGGEGELNAVREVVEAFETANPGVTVDFTGVAEQGDHLARLTAGFAARSAPDVFLLNYRRVGPFIEKRVVEPVPESVDTGGFFEPPLEAFTAGGRLQCLPQNVSSSVVYVNERLFQQAGVPLPPSDAWDAAQLLDTARRLAAKGIEAIGFETGMRTVAPFTFSAGKEVVDDLAEPTRVTLDADVLRYLDQLQRTGFDARQRAAEDVQDAFAAGRLAMLVDSRRAVPAFRKSGVPFDVRPFPGEHSLLASDGWCVSAASRNRAAAQAFALFTTGEEGGAVLARSGRSVPVNKELAQGPAFLDPAQRPRSSKVFLDAVPGLERLPNVAAQHEAEEAADDLLEQYFAGRLPVEQVVERVARATADVYAQER